MVFATSIYVIAFFFPWIWEQYGWIITFPRFQPEIYPSPSIPCEGWFWPFLVVIRTTRNDNTILLFSDYWFNAYGIHHQKGFSGWLGVFIFQVLTILMAVITILRKNVNKKLSIATTAVLSIISPIFCIYQRFSQSTYFVDSSQFFVGFWLAIISSTLFFVSLRFAKNTK